MKSEKEKMISGELYNALTDELIIDRQKAREILFEFNNLGPLELEKRNLLIRSLLGSVKSKFHIEPPFRCDYGYNIEIGDNFFANFNLVILDCARVKIGNNVLIGPDAGIYTAGHPIHYKDRNKELEFALPVTIGDNVWIGGKVIINPGITIGDNSVIGSGSVVTKNIPANVVAAGNPCKVLRDITDEDKLG